MMFPQESTASSSQDSPLGSQETQIEETVYLTDFVSGILGDEKKNRLESILSELIIFGMNTGQWRHATFAQKAYEQIAGASAIGPIVSAAYIAMGYGKLSEAIEEMQNKQEKVSSEQIWGLRAFIGMFMIFNDSKAEAQHILEEVVKEGDEPSQQMASQLLLQFFDAAVITPARSKARVPGLPM